MATAQTKPGASTGGHAFYFRQSDIKAGYVICDVQSTTYISGRCLRQKQVSSPRQKEVQNYIFIIADIDVVLPSGA